jgi:hypothetical protein
MLSGYVHLSYAKARWMLKPLISNKTSFIKKTWGFENGKGKLNRENQEREATSNETCARVGSVSRLASLMLVAARIGFYRTCGSSAQSSNFYYINVGMQATLFFYP